MDMKKKIVDKSSYYAFKNRLLCFNKQYENDQFGSPNLDESYFEPIAAAWENIVAKYPKNVTLEQIEEADFQNLKNAATQVYERIREMVEATNRGGYYIDDDDEDQTEYTYLAGDLLDIGMAAIRSYTRIFDLCTDCVIRPNGDRALASARATALADAFYNQSKLPVLETTDKVKNIYSQPYYSGRNENNVHTKDTYLTHITTETRMPYIEYMNIKNGVGAWKDWDQPYQQITKVEHILENPEEPLEDDRQPVINNVDENVNNVEAVQPNEVINNEEEVKEEANPDDDANSNGDDAEEKPVEEEGQKIIQEDPQPRRIELVNEENRLPEYDQVKTTINNIERYDGGWYTKSDKAFIEYYKKFADNMGISSKRMDGRAVLTTAMLAHVKTKNHDNDEFRREVTAFYTHFRRQVFESYVTKCANDNQKIDLNYASGEIDKMMGALYYAIDPVGINENDPKSLARAKMLMTGALSSNEHELSLEDRDAVLAHRKEAYREKAERKFEKDVNARFESYTKESKMSISIANNASRLVKQYKDSQKATDDKPAADRHTQIELKKLVMDEACALEKRIDTRYASRASRFFRFISYRIQLNQLNRMKDALGIPQNEKVASKYVDMRLNDQFVDDSDRTLYNRDSREVDETTLSQRIISDVNDKVKFPEVTQDDMMHTYKMLYDRVYDMLEHHDDGIKFFTREDLHEIQDVTNPVAPSDLEEEIKANNEAIEKAEKEKREQERLKDQEPMFPRETYSFNGQEYDSWEDYDLARRIYELEETQKREAEERLELRKGLYDKKLKDMERLLSDVKVTYNDEKAKREINLALWKKNLDDAEKELKLYEGEIERIKGEITDYTSQYAEAVQTFSNYATLVFNEADEEKRDRIADINEQGRAIEEQYEADEMIGASKMDLAEIEKQIDDRELQKKNYEANIIQVKKEIETAKTKVGDFKREGRKEREFGNQVHALEAQIRNWTADKERIINEGVGISENELYEYRHDLKYNIPKKEELPANENLPDDYEEPIELEGVVYGREHVDVNLESNQKQDIAPKVLEDDKQKVMKLEK